MAYDQRASDREAVVVKCEASYPCDPMGQSYHEHRRSDIGDDVPQLRAIVPARCRDDQDEAHHSVSPAGTQKKRQPRGV